MFPLEFSNDLFSAVNATFFRLLNFYSAHVFLFLISFVLPRFFFQNCLLNKNFFHKK